MSIRNRILDVAVTLADRLEDDAGDRFCRETEAMLDGRSEEWRYNAARSLASLELSASIAVRHVARVCGRPSFSPLMARAQGLDDDDLRDGATMGDA